MSHTAHAASVSEFIDFSSAAVPGRLYVPPDASVPSEPRPLILFLHGLGGKGNNNLSQIGLNIDNLLANSKLRGAYLYAPQATSGSWSFSSRTAAVMSMVDLAIDEHHVDASRLYVTGLSMGGGGTWNMLSRYSDRFAAGVPIAGSNPGGDFNPSNLIETPTWAFHARNDDVVSKNSSRTAISRIIIAAGEPLPTFPPSSDASDTLEFVSSQIDLSYTEFPTGRHSIWSRVYDRAEIYNWMFSKSLATSVPEPTTFTLSLFGLLGWGIHRRKQVRTT